MRRVSMCARRWLVMLAITTSARFLPAAEEADLGPDTAPEPASVTLVPTWLLVLIGIVVLLILLGMALRSWRRSTRRVQD